MLVFAQLHVNAGSKNVHYLLQHVDVLVGLCNYHLILLEVILAVLAGMLAPFVNLSVSKIY